MQKTVSVDYLAFTAKGKAHKAGFVPPPITFGQTWKQDVGRFGYKQSAKYDSGVVVLYDGGGQDMGNHYIYSGQAITNLMTTGTPPDKIVAWHMGKGHVCKRIDLAVDVKDDEYFMEDVKNAARQGAYSGSARSTSLIEDVKTGGATVYMGKRTSPKFVRIYDKGVESGQGGLWVRVEAEVKGLVAHGICKAIETNGLVSVSSVAQSVICDVCQFKTAGWLLAFSGDALPIARPQFREADTEAWLLSTCARSLARYELENPDSKIIERFMLAVETLLFDQ